MPHGLFRGPDEMGYREIVVLQDADAAMEAVRGPLGRQRMISAAWDREGGHGVLKGRNETAFPPPPRKPYPRLRK